jgi:hypothetical protein
VDKYLVTLAFLMLFAEIGWLAEDLNLIDIGGFYKKSIDTDGETLGQITIVKKDVRKKSNSSLVWEDTRDSQKVFAFDSVLTLDQSATEVSLNSGSKITLHENTLVSIEPIGSSGKSGGPVRLRFHRGTVKANMGREPASLDTGDWVVEAEPQSKITIRSRGPDQYEVESTRRPMKFRKS